MQSLWSLLKLQQFTADDIYTVSLLLCSVMCIYCYMNNMNNKDNFGPKQLCEFTAYK